MPHPVPPIPWSVWSIRPSRKLSPLRIASPTRAAHEWDKNHPVRPDRDEFTREILPYLDGVSYSALSRASGLSRRYCKLIATGEYVPHPVHWDAIRSAVGSPTAN